jgi:hypothetical protein
MFATKYRRLPSEAVRAIRLKVLLAASSAQHPTPLCLTICVNAVFALCNSS